MWRINKYGKEFTYYCVNRQNQIASRTQTLELIASRYSNTKTVDNPEEEKKKPCHDYDNYSN